VEALDNHNTSPSTSTLPLLAAPWEHKHPRSQSTVSSQWRSEARTKGVQEGEAMNGTGERARRSARHRYHEALRVASRHGSSAAAPRRLQDHQMRHGVEGEGMHGTIQDPTMHMTRDKATLLQNTIMKHRGSTQQPRYQPLDQRAVPSGGAQRA